MMDVRQLVGGCDQITGEGHSPVLRAEDPLVVVEVVAKMRKASFTHFPKRPAQEYGAITEQAWIDAGLHKPELEMHE